MEVGARKVSVSVNCFSPLPKMLFAEVLSKLTPILHSYVTFLALFDYDMDFPWNWAPCPHPKQCLTCGRYSVSLHQIKCHFLRTRQETGTMKINKTSTASRGDKWGPWQNRRTTWCMWTMQLQAEAPVLCLTKFLVTSGKNIERIV